MIRHVFLVSLAVLGACASAPDPAREAPRLPDRFSTDAALTPSAIAPAWWTQFRDPALDQRVDLALQHNVDLQLAVARVDETAALVGLARAAQWPGLDLGGTVVRSRVSTLNGSPVAATGPESTTHRLVLSSAFEIDLWGRLRQARAAAQAQMLSAEHARDAVRVALVAGVVQTYFGVRALDAQIGVLDAQVDARRASLKIVERRLESGIASTLERAQAQTALAATLVQRPELQRQRALLAHQLGVLTGTPGRVIERRPDALATPLVVPAGLPSELLLRRADLRSAEAALRAADAQVAVARAAVFPTLSLTSFLGGQSADLVDLLKGGARIWSISPSLLLPLFDGGRNAARTAQAQAQAEQAALGYRKAVQTAFREVADALAAREASCAQENEIERQRTAASDALRIAERRYEAGYSGFLEVLDAQRQLHDAELARLRVQQSRLDASVALLKALGGGWATPS